MKDNLFKTEAPSSWFYFWKGRVALFCLLKSLNLNKQDEVILPGLTCVVVPNAIIYAGLKPVYVDINTDTYNLDVNLIEQKITKRTKAIIIQNTFGLSTNVEEIIAIAKKHQLITIDDCTHGYGGYYNDLPNGHLADAAFFSSQWNKPFSTVIGGYLKVNNPKLLDGVKEEYRSYKKPSLSQNVKIILLYYIKKVLVHPRTYWLAIACYRWLSQHNLILGSSQGGEITTVIKPKSYEMKLGWAQMFLGRQQLKKIQKVLEIRQESALLFSDWLKKNNKKYVKLKYHKNHSWLKYPIEVKDRGKFFQNAEKANISLGDWFISPIHPVTENLNQWDYQKGSCVRAEAASADLVNLPTDIGSINKIIHFLEDNKDLIK